MFFFTDTFDGRTYGPFPTVAVAHEYMAEIGYISAFPTFEADSHDDAIAPADEWMAEALRITQTPAPVFRLTIPAIYALDFLERAPCDSPEEMPEEISSTFRTVTVECNAAQLACLKGDAAFYAEGNTDDTSRAIVRGAKRTLEIIAASGR